MTQSKTKAPAKESTAKRTPAAKKETRVGQEYECGVCGVSVTINEDCGCVEECYILCCSEPMQPKRSSKSRTASKPK